MRKHLFLSFYFLIAVAGCSESDSPTERKGPKVPEVAAARQPETPLDACSLLTAEEIQAALGEAPQTTKADRKVEGGFVISQCYFTLPTASNSFTLRLVQRGDGPEAREPHKVWKESFASELVEKAVAERKKAPPERVLNLGDEAFWLGGPKIGGLYVLKGYRYIRLGVGGEDNQPIKIELATKLAHSILARL